MLEQLSPSTCSREILNQITTLVTVKLSPGSISTDLVEVGGEVAGTGEALHEELLPVLEFRGTDGSGVLVCRSTGIVSIQMSRYCTGLPWVCSEHEVSYYLVLTLDTLRRDERFPLSGTPAHRVHLQVGVEIVRGFR